MWRHRSGSLLAQVMVCCLMAPSHYLNQCWLDINFTRSTHELNPSHVFWYHTFGIITTSPMGQELILNWLQGGITLSRVRPAICMQINAIEALSAAVWSFRVTIEVWEWISHFLPHFIGPVITYPYWYQSWSMLVKGTLFETKPLPEPVLTYCQLDLIIKTSVKFISYTHIFIQECHLQNGSHFVEASLHQFHTVICRLPYIIVVVCVTIHNILTWLMKQTKVTGIHLKGCKAIQAVSSRMT